MSSVIRLIICRYPSLENPFLPAAFGVISGETVSFGQEVTIEEVTLVQVLHDLKQGRAIYRTAVVGKGRDKLAVEPRDEVLRLVGDDGVEWLATSPDDTTRDNLHALPTRRALNRWLLGHSPTTMGIG